MEPGGSLPHSQKPATCPYLVPDQYSAYLDIPVFKVHFNIIFPYIPRSCKWFLFLRFYHQTPIHAYHMPNPSNYFYLVTRIILAKWYIALKLLIVQSSPVPCYFAPLKSRYLYQHPVHHSKCLKQLCPSCYATSRVSLFMFLRYILALPAAPVSAATFRTSMADLESFL